MDPILPGNRYRLYRMVTGVPEFVCMATTLSHTETKDMDTGLRPDCDDPTAPATNVSVPRSTSFSINGSGLAIMRHYAVIKADYASQTPVAYRIVADPEDGEGAGRWDGDVHITNLQFQKQNEGLVQFSFQMVGQGEFAFTAT